MKRKGLVIFLASILAFSLAACTNAQGTNPTTQQNSNQNTDTTVDSQNTNSTENEQNSNTTQDSQGGVDQNYQTRINVSINPNADIEIQESDSTTGINSTIEGICDIGMTSRALKESEIEAGLTDVTIALDGIAIIVNKANDKEELSSETVKKIYTGEVTTWEEVR